MEQTRHRLSAKHKSMSQQDIPDGFDSGCLDDGMEQILQILGGKFVRSDSACVQDKPCYNRARLETSPPSVKRKKCTPHGATSRHIQEYVERRESLSQNR